MVRDARAGQLRLSRQVVKVWAEQSNSADTEHGRLIGIAGPLLLEAVPDVP
ncbi:MAG TPA: hypothetical protein VG015_06335 [Candidatus Dormibacteraeota bacterium]|jgi:hypothetical protein|nr:hypothetical protein [Candidatus Dormibacteraeota bacterium]